MVEKKCVEIDQQQAATTYKLINEQWQALIALHSTPRFRITRPSAILYCSFPRFSRWFHVSINDALAMQIIQSRQLLSHHHLKFVTVKILFIKTLKGQKLHNGHFGPVEVLHIEELDNMILAII